MNARRLIDEGKFDEASEIVNGTFLLVVDGYAKFENDTDNFREHFNICVIDEQNTDHCNQ